MQRVVSIRDGSMRAMNHTRQRPLIEKATVAASPWARLRGLLGRKKLESGDGMILPKARMTLAPLPMGIHTIGMRYPIDVVFVDPNGRIVRMIHSMKPYRISPLVWNASLVLELPAGILLESGTEVGDQIELISGNRTQAEPASGSSTRVGV